MKRPLVKKDSSAEEKPDPVGMFFVYLCVETTLFMNKFLLLVEGVFSLWAPDGQYYCINYCDLQACYKV